MKKLILTAIIAMFATLITACGQPTAVLWNGSTSIEVQVPPELGGREFTFQQTSGWELPVVTCEKSSPCDDCLECTEDYLGADGLCYYHEVHNKCPRDSEGEKEPFCVGPKTAEQMGVTQGCHLLIPR